MSRQPSQPRRRQMLRQCTRTAVHVAGLLAVLGLMPVVAQAARPAFEARSLPALLQALGAPAPVASADVRLEVPDVAENGAVVPVRMSTALTGVRQMLLLVENNPALLCAQFELTPAVEADFSLRVKMAESTGVLAVALMDDGRVLYARRHVTVVLGGCA